MIYYKIAYSEAKPLIYVFMNGSWNSLPYNDAVFDLEVEEEFMIYRYGVKLNSFEIESFKVHNFIWSHFAHSNYEQCLIFEEGVTLTETINDCITRIQTYTDDWDIIFPYDKMAGNSRTTAPEIQISSQGYYWGSYIYFLNRQGATKLLNIKKIKLPLDEEILGLVSIGELEIAYDEMDCFTYDERRSPAYIARRESLADTIFGSPAWSDSNKGLAIKLIHKITEYTQRLNIDLVLHGGTLLGAVRHGGIMAWDDDIDFGINKESVATLIDAISRDGLIKHMLLPYRIHGVDSIYYKLWLDEGEPIERYPYKFPFVDLWLYEEKDGLFSYKEGAHFPQQVYFPFETVLFEGSYLQAPGKPLETLDILFKNWRECIQIYAWSHREEKRAFRQLKINIEVDNTGKLKNLV